jgi:hypothetical protein
MENKSGIKSGGIKFGGVSAIISSKEEPKIIKKKNNKVKKINI